jgi:hypothetical protein
MKLNGLIQLGASPPRFDTRAQIEVHNVLVLTKPFITEEIWPGRGLNPGLPYGTPVLYPDIDFFIYGQGDQMSL